MKQNRQTIRLNENQLKQVIKESIKKVLKEGFVNDFGISYNNPASSDFKGRHGSQGYIELDDGSWQLEDDGNIIDREEIEKYMNDYNSYANSALDKVKQVINAIMERAPKSYHMDPMSGRKDTINKTFNRGMGSLAFIQILPDEDTILVNKVIARKKDIEYLHSILPEWKMEFVELGYPDWYSCRNLSKMRH